MAVINQIEIDGVIYRIKDEENEGESLQWVPNQHVGSGTQVVGTMTFGGTTYTVYAPEQSVSNSLDISVTSTNLIFDRS